MSLVEQPSNHQGSKSHESSADGDDSSTPRSRQSELSSQFGHPENRRKQPNIRFDNQGRSAQINKDEGKEVSPYLHNAEPQDVLHPQQKTVQPAEQLLNSQKTRQIQHLRERSASNEQPATLDDKIESLKEQPDYVHVERIREQHSIAQDEQQKQIDNEIKLFRQNPDQNLPNSQEMPVRADTLLQTIKTQELNLRREKEKNLQELKEKQHNTANMHFAPMASEYSNALTDTLKVMAEEDEEATAVNLLRDEKESDPGAGQPKRLSLIKYDLGSRKSRSARGEKNDNGAQISACKCSIM